MNNIVNLTPLLFLLVFYADRSSISNENYVEKTDTIQWNPHRRLTWEDFQGPPTEQSVFSAETHYVITYSYRKSSRNKTADIKFKIHCYFEKGRSWAKTHDANDQLLSHEQAHFDIAELHTRLFRERVGNMIFDPAIFEDQIHELFSTILDECSQMQEKFDQETKFGTLAGKQKEWESFINKSINAYDYYRMAEVQSMSQQTVDIGR